MARKWIGLMLVLVLLGCGRDDAQEKPTAALEVRPGESIQAAVDAANPGETVLIHPGTYRPARPGEAMIVFKAEKNGVTLRGAGQSPAEVVIDAGRQALHVIFFDQGIDRSTVVENLTITGGYAFPGKLLPSNYKPVLRPEIDTFDNDFYHDGAGLMLFLSSPTIRNCRIINNGAKRCGGGISVFCPSEAAFPAQGPLIFGNEIRNNTVDEGTGGGVDVYFRAKADIVNNLFVGNKGWGGAVAVLDEGSAALRFNTIAGNYGSVSGLAMHATATVKLENTIFANNLDGAPVELPGKIAYANCCFWNNAEAWEPPASKGHILADPLFAKGPLGEYYLSHTSAGQAANSPCIDAGSGPSSSEVSDRTTRSDGGKDAGNADIGYHYHRTP
ncbi:MAG: right-handed parallel beta-helix repeat-containing protein [Planctomycetota bacterium]